MSGSEGSAVPVLVVFAAPAPTPGAAFAAVVLFVFAPTREWDLAAEVLFLCAPTREVTFGAVVPSAFASATGEALAAAGFPFALAAGAPIAVVDLPESPDGAASAGA